jgi:hypothetical protein
VPAYRTLGDVLSTAGTVYQQYNLSDYVPPEIQRDVATGEQLYSAASTVASSGSMSNEASKAADVFIATYESLPVVGTAFAAFMALAPKAGSGPGVCATDPPASPAPSDLAAWSHFTSWQSWFGGYPTYPAGSFEAFANPLLEYNWLLFANCFADSKLYMAPPVLLGLLINAWNSKHAPSVQRTIVRTGLNPPGFSPEASYYDPIANALEIDAIAKSAAANNQPGVTFEQSIAATAAAPNNITSSFVINDGPLQLRALTLHMSPGSSATAAPSVAKKAAGVAAAAGASLTVAAIAISLVKGKAWDWAFGQAWTEIKDVFDKGGPHKLAGIGEEPVGLRRGHSRRRRH